MNILAIHYGFNASIAYVEDGKLLYLLHEEKFDNIKNSMGLPVLALAYLKTKVDFSKIDRITVNPKNLSKPTWERYKQKVAPNQGVTALKKYTLRDKIFYYLYGTMPVIFNWYNDYKVTNKGREKAHKAWLARELTTQLGVPVSTDMIDITEHHITHALSTVYFYGLHQQDDPVLLMSLDGAGDRYCASVRRWEKGTYTTLGVTRFYYSLGFLRSYVTGALGMKPHEHEYKVMGLAAYTSPKYYMDTYNKLFKNMFTIEKFSFKSRIPLNLANVYLYDKLYGIRFDNLAGALQHLTEEIVIERITKAVEQTGIKKIALSGGVFMNVKLNKKIQEMNILDKVYFMPSAGDESTVLGQVLQTYVTHNLPLAELEPLKTMYSGLPITTPDTLDFIEKHVRGKYEVEDLKTDEESAVKVAELLAKFEIVGVCRGNGEWGARSLCNRGILSNASDLKNFHTVNDMIKMRDFWMPFAPTMLEEMAAIYLKDWDAFASRVKESSYFMINAFDSTPIAQEHLRAAIHQKDKTLRPQLVNTESNAWMYKMLQEYKTLTGMGGVMNTSLNIHGYPLVGALDQALFTFENSGLQHILLDHFLVSKKA